MNQASFFIEKKALFGGYPTHKEIKELKDEGVVWFVDLTADNERNTKAYSHLVDNWISYPIKDRHVPEDKKKFTVFLFIIQMVLESLKPGEKIYLHCRGGHGRSSLVIACFLGLILRIPPDESLKLVKEYHMLRPNLRSKWLIRWPLSVQQQRFVVNFFGSMYLYSNFRLQEKAKVEDTKLTKMHYFKTMLILNFYLHQNPTILEVLLNSGLKKIEGEGIISIILQELRSYILYSYAKKFFE